MIRLFRLSCQQRFRVGLHLGTTHKRATRAHTHGRTSERHSLSRLSRLSRRPRRRRRRRCRRVVCLSPLRPLLDKPLYHLSDTECGTQGAHGAIHIICASTLSNPWATLLVTWLLLFQGHWCFGSHSHVNTHSRTESRYAFVQKISTSSPLYRVEHFFLVVSAAWNRARPFSLLFCLIGGARGRGARTRSSKMQRRSILHARLQSSSDSVLSSRRSRLPNV